MPGILTEILPTVSRPVYHVRFFIRGVHRNSCIESVISETLLQNIKQFL